MEAYEAMTVEDERELGIVDELAAEELPRIAGGSDTAPTVTGTWEADGSPLDDDDAQLVRGRAAGFDGVPGPRVGDYVRFQDGHLERFSHDWGDGLQTAIGGSWYLGTEGYVSFSGSLNPMLAYPDLQLTKDRRDGAFWCFHHDHWRAGNAIRFELVCNVYVYGAPAIAGGSGDEPQRHVNEYPLTAPEKINVYNAGYRDGATDRRLNLRSEYASNYQRELPNSYPYSYGVGYVDGYNGKV